MSERLAGRPRSATAHAALLRATRELLIEVGYDRLTMDAVAARAGASKNTIYRRWANKAELVVAAIADARRAPPTPDLGSLRQDLLACAQAFVAVDDDSERLLSGLLTEMARNDMLRVAARQALGAPYAQLFLDVLTRAVVRGLVDPATDIATVAQIFPAFALHRVVVEGYPVDEELAVRIVDGVLCPVLQPPER